MKTHAMISLIVATALALTSVSAVAQGRQQGGSQDQPQDRAQVERGQRSFDRDRMRDRDRIGAPDRGQVQDRDKDRTNAPDNTKNGDSEIYGQELMSVQERNQYREQLRLTESDPEAQTQFKAQHAEEMRARAKEQGVTVKEPADRNDEK